jgi:hypothetical protein
MVMESGLSSNKKILRDRIVAYNRPDPVKHIPKIEAVERIWVKLLYAVILNCPENYHLTQALIHLEQIKDWARKAIIRGTGEGRDVLGGQIQSYSRFKYELTTDSPQIRAIKKASTELREILIVHCPPCWELTQSLAELERVKDCSEKSIVGE